MFHSLSQDVARPVVDTVLEGFNGTVFAYGQTGSGKTFTITGGAERYADRGLIPRTLSYLFQAREKKKEEKKNRKFNEVPFLLPSLLFFLLLLLPFFSGRRCTSRILTASTRRRFDSRVKWPRRTDSNPGHVRSLIWRFTMRTATTCCTRGAKCRGWRIYRG